MIKISIKFVAGTDRSLLELLTEQKNVRLMGTRLKWNGG